MNNLQELILFLDKNIKENYKLSNLTNIIDAYSGDDWKKYIKFNNNKYTRINIIQKEKYEIVLLCWNSFQQTPIHDHAENGCIMKLLQGELIEQQYNPQNLQLQKENKYFKGNVAYIDNSICFHKVINPNIEKAISLHIYSPPNYKANIYN